MPTESNPVTVPSGTNDAEGNNMSYTLGQAARATGKSKTTIQRAIRSGKISAEKTVNGAWEIEPSEVHRVYPEVSPVTVAPMENGEIRDSSLQQELHHELALRDEQLASARKEIAHLAAQVEDLRTDRNAWRAEAQRKRLTWRGLFGGGKAE